MSWLLWHYDSGMVVDNYLQEELANTSLQVLEGDVIVELSDRGQNYSLVRGDSMQVGGSGSGTSF